MVNRVFLFGRLSGSPQLMHQPDKMMATFILETTSQHRDDTGQVSDRCEKHRVVAWGRNADTVYRFAMNGSLIALDGQLHNSEHTDSNGAMLISTVVSAHKIFLIGNRKVFREQFHEV